MRGYNKKRPSEQMNSGKHLQVSEIWPTIQGEGPFAGRPAVFVRLTGCHLQCEFCDTEWDDEKDPYMEVDTIIETMEKVRLNELCNFVVLTGGEPLRQNVSVLIKALSLAGWTIQIETAGNHWCQELLDSKVFVVVSPKVGDIHPKIKHLLTDRPSRACLKYIYRAPMPMLGGSLWPEMPTQRDNDATLPFRNWDFLKECANFIYLQPCDEGPSLEEVTKRNHEMAAEYIIQAQTDRLCLSIQMHKLIGVK